MSVFDKEPVDVEAFQAREAARARRKYPSFDDKRRRGQALRKQIDQCTDQLEKMRLENELTQLHFDHYSLPMQKNWPLHEWPWKGTQPHEEGPPRSHMIKAGGKGHPHAYAWLNRSYAIEKFARMHETVYRSNSFNPRRTLFALIPFLGVPYFIYTIVMYDLEKQKKRVGQPKLTKVY